jgi:hypothetical protein
LAAVQATAHLLHLLAGHAPLQHGSRQPWGQSAELVTHQSQQRGHHNHQTCAGKPQVSNAAIAKPQVSNAAIVKPQVSNAAIAKPQVSNAAIAKPQVSNAAIVKPQASNAAIVKPQASNAAIVKQRTPQEYVSRGAAGTTML